MTLDLLNESLIQTDTGWHSLPGLLAAMARGEVQAFSAIRPPCKNDTDNQGLKDRGLSPSFYPTVYLMRC